MRRKSSRKIKLLCCIFLIAYVTLQAHITFNHDWGFYKVDSSTRNSSSINNETDDNLYTYTPEIQINLHNQTRVYHVGFLKVHKAGSTTIQNMLFRFAIRHNLTVLLPQKGNYLLSRGMAMPLKKGNHYDIFACHAVFSNTVFGLLPADSQKVAIVRDPLERSISAAYYYRDVLGAPYLKRAPKEKFIESLISSPEKFDPGHFSATKNSMGKDFGFPPGIKNQKDRIASHMDHLKKEFKLVLVMERFEESLVLLKREFNWSLHDILFIRSNSNKHNKVNLTEAQRTKHKDINFLDYAIYKAFYPIFAEKVQSQGPSFKEEVFHFQSVLSNVKEFCNSTDDRSSLHVRQSRWNLQFKVLMKDCDLMRKDELLFINDLRQRHNMMQK